jgi:hypothetical protein
MCLFHNKSRSSEKEPFMTHDGRNNLPVKWHEFEMDGWGDEVGKNGWERRDDLFVIDVPCPRCGHGVGLAIPVGIATLLGSDFQRCSCPEPHAGRPENKVGCGAYGRVDNPPNAISLEQGEDRHGC